MKAKIAPAGKPLNKLEKLSSMVATMIIVLVPFHAFLTVWASSLIGHYTLLRLWDEILLMALVAITGWWLIKDKSLRLWLTSSLIFRLILIYSLLTVALGDVAYSKHEVTAKALGYGLIVNLRFLLFFLAAILVTKRSSWLPNNWAKLLLIPAIIVSVFAILQFAVLPHDFLRHFGYGSSTISPTETINHNSHYIRVQSTLRGGNPLGAYLVIALAAVASLWFAVKARDTRFKLVLIGLAAVLALFFSGSRSAWIGAFLALAVIVGLKLKTRRAKVTAACVVVAGLVVAGGLALAFRNNVGLENELLHTQKHSAVASSSNSAHASALKSGLSDVVHQPFGRGPGTAGPASVYNAPFESRIAENYYVQIAQETGWAGLILLLTIMVLVALELYDRRHRPLALALLASLAGLTFVNFLSHAWADDTLSYVWWGLAGVACAVAVKAPKSKEN